ncbi:MAG: hypothetical protein EXQ57_08855 [Bryobacterales bacterium]|nr:hypothetical protein [Bryobacterales bacterium]
MPPPRGSNSRGRAHHLKWLAPPLRRQRCSHRRVLLRLSSLRGDPENDRFRLSLLLHSTGGLRCSDFIHNSRFLGDDGRLIWFHAPGTAAYDYHAHKLLIGRTLPRTGEPHRAQQGYPWTYALSRLNDSGKAV